MRHSYAPFAALGIVFIALGSGGKTAFLGLGIAFLAIAAGVFIKTRRA